MTTITESNITQQLDLSQFTIVLPDDSVKQLVIYPSRADFPQPGKEARIYLAQDSGTLWLWDGSTYQQVADLPATFSETPPAHPYIGQRWTHTFDLTTYEWFGGSWVEKPTNN